MTDQNTDVENEAESHGSRRANLGIIFSTIALIVVIGGFAYGYFELSKVNVSLARKVTDLQNQVTAQQTNVGAMQKSVTDLQQSAQKTQDLAAQQQQFMTEWRAVQKGDLDKWHIAEAQYLVKLANDHLQFSYNTTIAQTLLEQADHTLDSIQDPGVLDMRKSIAGDLANLKAAPAVDVTAIYLQLNALNNQLEELPLPSMPLTSEQKKEAETVPAANLPWWKAGLQLAMQSLRQIVIVRYNNSNTLPLVLPEEKSYLYQNLHAQIESAMWGLLHRNNEVYLASLLRTMSWIKLYFVQDATVTKSIMQNLESLQAMNIQPPSANLTATLQLFDQYFAQAKQQTDQQQQSAQQPSDQPAPANSGTDQ